MASGTISGPDQDSLGSMLEITIGGKNPITLRDGAQRSFVEDGDTITLRGWAGSGEKRVGFGSVYNQVESALRV
jgi:fumarylacetoacetase